MSRKPPLILLTVAVALFVASIVYGVVMVGVPTQDPNSTFAASQTRDVALSDRGMLIGAGLGLLAMGWLVIAMLGRRSEK